MMSLYILKPFGLRWLVFAQLEELDVFFPRLLQSAFWQFKQRIFLWEMWHVELDSAHMASLSSLHTLPKLECLGAFLYIGHIIAALHPEQQLKEFNRKCPRCGLRALSSH